MAEQVTLNVNVETGEAVKNLGDLEKATKSVGKTTQQAAKSADTLEDKFDQLNKEIKDSPVNIRRMNKQIQEYQAIALEAGRTSPLGKKAIQEAAQLKDKYNDITAEVNRLANDGVKLQAALDLGTSITAGYSAFQGAMALSGVESEKLQETLVKLQAAQSLLIGVETIRKNLEKESTLVLVAKSAAEKVSTATTAAYTFVTSGATAVTKLLRLALLSLPFVAIGAAIVALVSYWDDLVGGIKSGLKWLGLYDDSEEKAQARTKARLKEERKLRKQRLKQLENSAKNEQNIHDNRIANMDNEIRLAKAQGKNTVDLEKQKLQLIKDSTKQQNELTEQRIELQKQEINLEIARLEGLGSLVSGLQKADEKLVKLKQEILDLDQEQIESTQAIENAETDLLVFEAEATKERIDNRKKIAEAEKKLRDDIIAANEKTLDSTIKTVKEEKEEWQKLFDDIGEEEEELTIENIEEVTERGRMLQQLKAGQINDEIEQERTLKKQQAQFDLEDKLEQLQVQGILTKELRTELEEETQREISRIDREAEIQRFQSRLELASQGANALQSLGDAVFSHKMKNLEKGSKEEIAIAKKQFKFNKALQLSMALIDGAKAITSSLAQSPLAIGPVPNPAGIASLAFATVTTAAQIATIAAQQFQGGSVGGGGVNTPNFGTGGGGGAAPQIDPVTNTSTLLGQEQTQVFVTETDITNTQNKVSVIETQATIK